MVQDQQGQVSVSCPTCRRSTLLPPSSTVADLQSAFHIHHLFDIQEAFEKVKEPEKVRCGKCTKESRTATGYCRDCGEFICAACTDIHIQWDMFAGHEVVALNEFEKKVKQLDTLKKVTLYCSLHKGKELELYCETCEELICLLCTVKKHKDHQYDLVTDTFEQHKAEITASLEPVVVRLEATKTSMGQIDTQSKAVEANGVAVDAEIDKEINELQNILEARRAELKTNAKTVTQMKLKNLATQKDEMETVQTQLVSCLSFVQESIRTGSSGQVMKMKKGVIGQIKEITNSVKADPTPPCESPDIKFSASPKLARSCRQFGEVQVHTKSCTSVSSPAISPKGEVLQVAKISPRRSYATGKGLKGAVRGENNTAVVHVCDEKGRVYPNIVESLVCELTSDTNAYKIKGELKKTKDGQFEISYKPTSRGRHQLHVKVEGEHIKGSPFGVTVKLPIRELGTQPVRTINRVSNPWGVAVNQRGEIMVIEGSKHCVSIFAPSGEKIRWFGSRGGGQGQFESPVGVDCDNDGNILVVECANHRIQKFSTDGKFIASVGTPGRGQLQFYCPIGIKVNPHTKRIYVVDQCNHQIQVLQPDLSFFSSFGSRGSGPGQLSNPRDVAFDSASNVYVTDYSNNRIQVYRENGEFIRQIEKKGTRQDELKNPSFVTIDDEDRIFVTDTGNHRVSVFTSKGRYLASFGSQGSGPQQFQSPCGIAVDKSGMIYVCDDRNSRVQVF